MASDLNKVFLIGRLTRDPELKSTSSGSYFCKFSIASNRTFFRKDQEATTEVGFFDCIAWGKQAEVISRYLQKGRRVGIDGFLRWSSWENSEGKKQTKVEIQIDNFQFLDPKSAETNSENLGSFNQETKSEAPPNDVAMGVDFPAGEDEMSDNDVPF